MEVDYRSSFDRMGVAYPSQVYNQQLMGDYPQMA